MGRFLNELNVEDLPRRSSLIRVGEDLVEALEPCRMIGIPGPVEATLSRTLCDGDGKGDVNPRATSSADGERRALTAEDSVPRFRLELFADAIGVDSLGVFDFWGRCDRLKRGAGFFRRGRRKKVVVV
jgi:hypothetical protein